MDCSHCVFFQCWNKEWKEHDATGERGSCSTHSAEIPETTPDHRICGSFVPSAIYIAELSNRKLTIDRKIEDFGKQLDSNCLYRFTYNCPDQLTEMFRFSSP